MSYSVKTISVFDRQIKRLIKKFPSLKKELQTLITHLTENPIMGTSIGHDCYKIRLAIASKGKGKSGGAKPYLRISRYMLKPKIQYYMLPGCKLPPRQVMHLFCYTL